MYVRAQSLLALTWFTLWPCHTVALSRIICLHLNNLIKFWPSSNTIERVRLCIEQMYSGDGADEYITNLTYDWPIDSVSITSVKLSEHMPSVWITYARRAQRSSASDVTYRQFAKSSPSYTRKLMKAAPKNSQIAENPTRGREWSKKKITHPSYAPSSPFTSSRASVHYPAGSHAGGYHLLLILVIVPPLLLFPMLTANSLDLPRLLPVTDPVARLLGPPLLGSPRRHGARQIRLGPRKQIVLWE